MGALLYVLGGYVSGDEVLSQVDVFDQALGQWTERFAMPPRMAQSHLALCTDGERFIYAISGQLGNQCHPPTPDCFVLDLTTRTWSSLPPLPQARYAATAQLWSGRIHVVGGSKEDRGTPASDHWSIAVKDGKAGEVGWRVEAPIPRGGPHRSSAVVENRLYVLGGQVGDYVPIPGDPTCRCSGDLVTEWHHAEVYRADYCGAEWRRMADLSLPASHTEFSVLVKGHRVVLFGGQHHRDPETKVMSLTDAIQSFDTRANRCEVIGALPYRVKTNLVGFWDGVLTSSCGQRDRGRNDATPGSIVSHTWRTAGTPLLTRGAGTAD